MFFIKSNGPDSGPGTWAYDDRAIELTKPTVIAITANRRSSPLLIMETPVVYGRFVLRTIPSNG